VLAALQDRGSHDAPALKKKNEWRWPGRDCFASIAMLESCFHGLASLIE
jgi:hypothetical protein